MSVETDLILKAISDQGQVLNGRIKGVSERVDKLADAFVNQKVQEERLNAIDKETHEAFQRIHKKVETTEKELKEIQKWQNKNSYLADIGTKVIIGVITAGSIAAIVSGMMNNA